MSAWHLRFYRRIRLLPGVWLNFSKSGMSITVGIPGCHLTFGHHGITYSVGIPGSGLSMRRRIRR
jgi:hypothetical protein